MSEAGSCEKSASAGSLTFDFSLCFHHLLVPPRRHGHLYLIMPIPGSPITEGV
jgi:hypothetical protein